MLSAAMLRLYALLSFSALSGTGIVQGQPRFSVTPVLEIPLGEDSGTLVTQVVGATRFSDGSIAVADAEGVLRFYNPAGGLRTSVGRNGSGPGEFQRIVWIGQCRPDTVFVWDLPLARMTVVSREGRVIRQYPVPARGARSSVPFKVACNMDGVFLFQSLPREFQAHPSEPGVVRGRAPVWIGDSGGETIATIGTIPTDEMVELGGDHGARGGGPRPLGSSTALTVSRTRAFVGTADSAFVEVYELSGGRRRGISPVIDRRRPTPQNHQHAVAAVLAEFPPSLRQALGKELASVPLPTRLPPYFGMRVDSQGLLWILLSAPGDPYTRMRAFTEDGVLLADLHVSYPMTVYEIGPDFLLGLRESRDGEARLVVGRLERPSIEPGARR